MSIPASASEPQSTAAGAHIELTIMLKPRQPLAGALLLPTARSIILTEGTYYFSNIFDATDSNEDYFNDRTIALAAGEYRWNCRVWFVDGSTSQYRSNCWLWRVGTGGYAYLPDLWVNAGPNGTNYSWSSELVRA
jgi:hypothetical protein